MTIGQIRELLVGAIAAEAALPPTEVATDRPFTAFGVDSMAAMSVGIEIEERCGLSDLPASLLWDYPTVDTLTDALWAIMNASAVGAVSQGAVTHGAVSQGAAAEER